MSDRDWLQNLKVGDQVVEDRHFQGRDISIVSRITNTLIIVKNPKGFESRYRKTDGFNPGTDRVAIHMLRQATPEALAKLEEERYRQVFQNKLSHLSWADVPLDRIKEIRELIEPYIKRKEN